MSRVEPGLITAGAVAKFGAGCPSDGTEGDLTVLSALSTSLDVPPDHNVEVQLLTKLLLG